MDIMDYLVEKLDMDHTVETQYIADKMYYRLDYACMYQQIKDLLPEYLEKHEHL